MIHDRRSKPITHDGETLSMTAWSQRLGGNNSVVHRRLKRGWPTDRAVSEPLGVRVKPVPNSRERLMVILDLWPGATTEEIGAKVGLPRASVCRLLHEARTKLGIPVPHLPRGEAARRAQASRKAARTTAQEAHRTPQDGMEAPEGITLAADAEMPL